MSPPGRPKGERRSAQREGNPTCPPGRPKGEYRTAEHDRTPVSLSRNDVERIAQLARLEIDPGAADAVRAKLAAILGLIDELNAVDTRGVVPMAHAQELALPLRDDAVTEPDRHALYQQQAPAVEDGLYLVPKVIE
jgi:aspartyl-tRNA(Asn)/glutamyl-tRNA(Gln) amidotransferase subunit C